MSSFKWCKKCGSVVYGPPKYEVVTNPLVRTEEGNEMLRWTCICGYSWTEFCHDASAQGGHDG